MFHKAGSRLPVLRFQWINQFEIPDWTHQPDKSLLCFMRSMRIVMYGYLD